MKKTANAKINIALRIKGLRPDGYHELDMIFLELPFGDEIEIANTAVNDKPLKVTYCFTDYYQQRYWTAPVK